MKYIKYLLFFVGILMFSSCQDKVKIAADYVCECNQGLVKHIEKMEILKAKNDVNSIAEMEGEHDIAIEKAEACLKKMEEELGKSTVNNPDFTVKVMAKIKTQCPDVYEFKENISLEK